MRSLLVGMLTALLTLAGGGVASASTYDIRGEWSVEAVCKGCTFPKLNKSSAKGTALIKTESGGGEFSGTVTLEGAPGTMFGFITGTQLAATIEATTPEGSLAFTLPNGTIDTVHNTIAGEGSWKLGASSGEAVISGSRIRTLTQIEEKEKEEREKKEKEEREKKVKEEAEAIKHAKEAEEAKAKEAAEKEAQFKQREEQRIRGENEAKEGAEREAKARAEWEAREREAHQEALGPAALLGKTFTLGGSGSLSLRLSNPNGSSVSGEVVLTASGHTSKAGKGGATVLGKGSFALTPHGTGTVKIKLSHTAVAELRHHHTLQATAQVTTEITGHPVLVSSDPVTVHGAAHKRR
jgi:outer membrane biosynthesis protein TonB